ncbi:MAG: chemotaxis protein CheX [Acidobacteriia bacterium]|nr:chemotaxis protein CheX [Terriglobia bacterium]
MNPALDSKIQNSVRPDATWEPMLECAVKEVFQIMLQAELTTIAKTAEEVSAGDTTAMVGLAGSLCGVMSIRCSSQTAESVAGRMLGSVGAVNPSEVPDALAEICNMVAGNFKSKITRLADNCMLSVPTVIRGEDYEMVTIADGEQIVVCVGYEHSPIWVTLAVHS